jgi:hypothetical protein
MGEADHARMARISRIRIGLKALLELGWLPLAQYALYQAGLKSGYFRLCTPVRTSQQDGKRERILQDVARREPFSLWVIPDRGTLKNTLGEQADRLIHEADEIVSGKVRLYGGVPVPLQLDPVSKHVHWSRFRMAPGVDIKDTWEPARFGWANVLGRAYILTGDELYPQAFWEYFEEFQQANPRNTGPNWTSAQEVAIRLLALSFAWQVFASSHATTPERVYTLVTAIAEHARRIPPTMLYARSQNNNHLLVEALGLLTAGVLLEGYPAARSWQRRGWHILMDTMQLQIDPDGTYIQHSMNYHRLMLQAALMAMRAANLTHRSFPPTVLERLQAATRWLLAQVDATSGKAPNLGHNDGGQLFALAADERGDYRAIAQAASRAFLERDFLGEGPLDEASLWLGLPPRKESGQSSQPQTADGVLKLGNAYSWGGLRAAQFHARPAHADQLHVELWWQGENIARDAGTFRYNTAAPWDNGLARTAVHNTLTIDGRSQMTRAGRFLWLDWAHAGNVQVGEEHVSAEHNGYRSLQVLHRRSLQRVSQNEWIVEDHLEGSRDHQHEICLHWLLPDWRWSLHEDTLVLDGPPGEVHLAVSCRNRDDVLQKMSFQLIRGSEIISGDGDADITLGWFSETYAHKSPALSARWTIHSTLPLVITSGWILKDRKEE